MFRHNKLCAFAKMTSQNPNYYLKPNSFYNDRNSDYIKVSHALKLGMVKKTECGVRSHALKAIFYKTPSFPLYGA